MAVTLADLAAFMGITSADPRYTQLQGVLDATVEHVEGMVGPVGGAGTFVVQPSGARLVLPAVRLVSVDGIEDPNGVAVTVTDCTVNLAAGVIVLPAAPSVAGGYTVTVTTPDSYRADEAVRIIAQHLWETRRGRYGARADAFAGDADPVPLGFAIPRRAAELLAPLMVPGFA